MKKTLLTTLLLSAIIFSAGAEKIIFSNAPDGYKEADISRTATINASNGDITVTAVSPDDSKKYWIVGEQSGYVGLYPSTYQTTANNNITLSWSVGFVSSCSTNGWSNSPAVTNGVHSIMVNVGTLPTTYTIDCTDLLGNTVPTASVTITETSSGGTPSTPTITYFTGTLNSTGDQATLRWASTNATYCRGSWSGTTNLSANNTAGTSVAISATTTYTLICYNNAGASPQSQTTVTVGGGGTPPANCPSAPAGTTLAISDTLYSLTNTTENNNPLINPGTGRVNFELYAGTYAAIPFTTPPAGDSGTIGFENPPGGQVNPGAYRVTISRCPGDFASGTGGIPQIYGCGRQGNPTTAIWSTETNIHPSKCKLEGGQYYLNIIHSSDYPNYINSSCTSSKCGVLFFIN